MSTTTRTLTVVALMAAALVITATSATAASELIAELGDDGYVVGMAARATSARRSFTTAAAAAARDARGHAVHENAVSFVVDVFGEELTLDLIKNHNLFAPGYVERIYDGDGNVISEANGRENCYYLGTVRGHEGSVVAMSTCAGLSGFLRLDRNSEEIRTEPAHLHLSEYVLSDPRRRQDLFEVPQIFYRDSARRGGSTGHDECGLSDSATDGDAAMSIGEPVYAPAWAGGRRRTTNYLEWAVVNDFSQTAWCAGAGAADCDSPEARAAALANNVAGRYRDTDGGFTPAMEVVLVEQRTWAGGDPIAVTTDVAATLAAFSTWRNAAGNDFDKNFNDAAHLITHVDFAGATVGLAYSSTACKSTAVGVSQDRGSLVGTGNTMAHELGHNLGMTHDGQMDCTIMAACACMQTCEEAGNTTNHWSQASRDAYAAYTATATCLGAIVGDSCAGLPALGDGQTAGTCVADTADGGSCTLGCEAGMAASGDLSPMCDDGVWTTVSGACVPVCEDVPAMALANDGDCVPDTPSGTICSPVCKFPFLPFVGDYSYSASSGDAPGIEFMCAAGVWDGPAGDAVCYYVTAFDPDGTTEIGTDGTAIVLDAAADTTTGAAVLTIEGGAYCEPKPGFTLTTEVMTIGLKGGELNNDADIGVVLSFLPGVTLKGRKRSRMRYCDPNANGGAGKWRKYGVTSIDHDDLVVGGAIPYPTAVAAFAKDGPVIIDPALAFVGLLALAGIAGGAYKNRDRLRGFSGSDGSAADTELTSVDTDASAQSSQESSQESSPGLPHGWESFVDDDGNTYYHNAASNETTWELPC